MACQLVTTRPQHDDNLWLTESQKPRVISAVVALSKHPKVANAFNKGQDAGIPSKTEACNGCGDNDEVVDGEHTLPAQVPVAKNHKDGNKSRHMSRFDAADEVLVTAPNEAACHHLKWCTLF